MLDKGLTAQQNADRSVQRCLADDLDSGGKLIEALLSFSNLSRHVVQQEPVDLAEGDDPRRWSHIRIATKYPHVAEAYFGAKGIQVEIIKLYGSMELAPLVGLADCIVDVVDTGKTLKANGLEPLELIMEVSSRLIVNKAAMKMKHAEVKGFIDEVKLALRQGEREGV